MGQGLGMRTLVTGYLIWCCFSTPSASVEEYKVMSNERTINKEGKRVSRER